MVWEGPGRLEGLGGSRRVLESPGGSMRVLKGPGGYCDEKIVGGSGRV